MRNQRWNACVSESFREWETGKVTILISYFQAYLTNYARLFLENNEDEKGFKKTTNLPSWSLLGHCQMCTRSQIGWTQIRYRKWSFSLEINHKSHESQNKLWKTPYQRPQIVINQSQKPRATLGVVALHFHWQFFQELDQRLQSWEAEK